MTRFFRRCGTCEKFHEQLPIVDFEWSYCSDDPMYARKVKATDMACGRWERNFDRRLRSLEKCSVIERILDTVKEVMLWR